MAKRARWCSALGATFVATATLGFAVQTADGRLGSGSVNVAKTEKVAGYSNAGLGAVQSPAADLRTPWKDPDLQGTWDFSTVTPLQRPLAFGDKAVLTEAEAAEFTQKTRSGIFGNDVGASGRRALNAAQDREVWWDPGTAMGSDRRTSLIVDPPDGRVPQLTREALKRVAARRPTTFENPEDAGTHYARCLLSMNAGPPILPSAYNNQVQVVQTPEYVTILTEMIHDARIVPLDGRPHLPPEMRLWMGDSRGRWDGQTLVIETTNFVDRPNFTGPTLLASGADRADDVSHIQFATTPSMRLIERLTRTSVTTMRYEFTVDDPAAFTRPWTAVIPFRRTESLIYEYACHEGNDGLSSILRTQRMLERSQQK